MITLKRLFAVTLAAAIALAIGRAQAQGSIPAPQSFAGIEKYAGEFDGFYPFASNNAAGGVIWYQVPVPANIPQNGAASLDFTNSAAMPAPSGIPAWGAPPNSATVFTNVAYRTILDLDVVATNANGFVTNYSTGAAYYYGTLAGGTNYYNVCARLGPNEQYGIVTNTGTGTGIVFDEIRN